ncbi:MAG TPA: DUF6499 domain-containing protein [Alphaproteobacteria bacterium]|nr:DUF6499 domain-containing protein [Alphaproteobacteria bacterium]
MAKSDWQSSAAYDYLCGRPVTGLAWEFLRRNPDYRADHNQAKRIATLSEPATAPDPGGLGRRWGLYFPA